MREEIRLARWQFMLAVGVAAITAMGSVFATGAAYSGLANGQEELKTQVHGVQVETAGRVREWTTWRAGVDDALSTGKEWRRSTDKKLDRIESKLDRLVNK